MWCRLGVTKCRESIGHKLVVGKIELSVIEFGEWVGRRFEGLI